MAANSPACPSCQSEQTRRTGTAPHLALEVWRCEACRTEFTTETREPRTAGGTRLVLNVDDRPPSLYVRRHILRTNGYAVADAASGRDAWSAARRLRPTAILMDVHLPDADGRLLCREMQNDADLKSIPIVLISATLTATNVPDPGEWGAVAFLREPIAPSLLAATMRRVLASGSRAK